MSRRNLLVAAGALLVTGESGWSEPPPEAFLFEHTWTFEPEVNGAAEEFSTRFGLLNFAGRSRTLNTMRTLDGEGWRTYTDVTALLRTSHVLFLTGVIHNRTAILETITSCASGLVLNLRAAHAAAPTDAGTAIHKAGDIGQLATSDFIRAYVQQVVAFDLEDARAAFSGQGSCQVAMSVRSGARAAIAASLSATEQCHGARHESPVTGQLLLLTHGSPAGDLRTSKEAFNAVRRRLPADAISLYAVGIDKGLPPDAVRATMLTSHGLFGKHDARRERVLHAT